MPAHINFDMHTYMCDTKAQHVIREAKKTGGARLKWLKELKACSYISMKLERTFEKGPLKSC